MMVEEKTLFPNIPLFPYILSLTNIEKLLQIPYPPFSEMPIFTYPEEQQITNLCHKQSQSHIQVTTFFQLF